MPPAHVSFVVDDGTRLTPALCRRLNAAGWRPVVVRPPWAIANDDRDARSGLADYVAIRGVDETHIQDAWDSVRKKYGPVGVLIFLQPRSYMKEDHSLIHASDLEAVKSAFLMAKIAQSALTESAAEGWGAFMTVTRLDGELGLSGTGDWNAAAGGLYGLTKTLRLEWPDVTCRAVDLDPEMDADSAADAIMAELQDPDRTVVEVAYGSRGRITLEAVATPVPALGGDNEN